MERAIVFGGGGFVGSAVVEALLAHGVEVCAVVKPGFWESEEAFRLRGLSALVAECDLRETRQLKGRLPWDRADVFYHLAWDGLSGDRMTDVRLQISNIQWMMDAVEAAAALGCGKFIGAGTISQDELRTPEGRACQNDRHRVFRCAAQCCEDMGRSVAHGCGIEFIWPILSNVYGEGELSPRLITTLIRKLLRGERMELSEGRQPYDFIYRADAGEAFYRIGERGKQDRRYRVASGICRPLREYLTEVQKLVAPDVDLRFGGRTGNLFFLGADSFDSSTLVEDTGFCPRFSFAEGIERTARWIREEEAGAGGRGAGTVKE